MSKVIKSKQFAIVAIIAGLSAISGLLLAAPPPRPRGRPVIHHRRAVHHRRVAHHRPLPPKLRPLPPYRRVWIRRVGPKVVLQRGETIIYKEPAVVVKTVSELPSIPTPTTTTITTTDTEQKSTAYKVVSIKPDCTIVLTNQGEKINVRLLGVTPIYTNQTEEKIETSSSQFIKNLLTGEFVYLQYDPNLATQDENGYTVAYLYRAPDNLFINLEIIRQGYGLSASDYRHEYTDLFNFYQKKAQADGKGIWASVEIAQTTPKESPKIAGVEKQ